MDTHILLPITFNSLSPLEQQLLADYANSLAAVQLAAEQAAAKESEQGSPSAEYLSDAPIELFADSKGEETPKIPPAVRPKWTGRLFPVNPNLTGEQQEPAGTHTDAKEWAEEQIEDAKASGQQEATQDDWRTEWENAVAKAHGRLIAWDLLDFEFLDRDQGIVYALTRLGRQVLQQSQDNSLLEDGAA